MLVGGGVEGNFSVSFGPKPGFRLWIWTWTKLNNKNPMCIQCVFKIISALEANTSQSLTIQWIIMVLLYQLNVKTGF